jgi:hypothetical protein
LGVSSTDIPLQGASTSSTPTAGEAVGHIVSGVGGLRLAKKALSGCARRKLKKPRARASEASIGGIQQPGIISAPKQGETPPKSLRGQSRRAVPLQKRPEHQKGPGTLRDQGLTRRLWPTLR